MSEKKSAGPQAMALYKPFPKSMIKQKEGFDFVSHSEYVQKFIDKMGVAPTFRVEDELYEDTFTGRVKGKDVTGTHVLTGVRCSMSATIDGHEVTVSEYGDVEFPMNDKTNGARAKKAISDAYKRCAMRLCGMGLHIYAGDEWRLEQAEEEEEPATETEVYTNSAGQDVEEVVNNDGSYEVSVGTEVHWPDLRDELRHTMSTIVSNTSSDGVTEAKAHWQDKKLSWNSLTFDQARDWCRIMLHHQTNAQALEPVLVVIVGEEPFEVNEAPRTGPPPVPKEDDVVDAVLVDDPIIEELHATIATLPDDQRDNLLAELKELGFDPNDLKFKTEDVDHVLTIIKEIT